MTRLSRRSPLPKLPMLLLAGLFLGLCSGGNGDTTQSAPSPQQIVTQLAQHAMSVGQETSRKHKVGNDHAV